MVSTPTNPVTAAIAKLLSGLELDDAGAAQAAIAVALAGKLDDAARSTSGAVAVAAAGLARELRATLAALLADQDTENDILLRDILGRAER